MEKNKDPRSLKMITEQATDPRSKKKSSGGGGGGNKGGGTGRTKQVWAESPFKSAESGNKFRAWVNTNYPTVATSVSLSPTGSYNNSYIKTAWEYPTTTGGKLGDEYLKTPDGQSLSGGNAQPAPQEDLSAWNDKANWSIQANTKCLSSLGSSSVFSVPRNGVNTPMLGVNTKQGKTYYFDMKGGVFNNKGKSLGLSYSCDGDKVTFFQAGTNESGLIFNTTSFSQLFQSGQVAPQPSPTGDTQNKEVKVEMGIEGLNAAGISASEAVSEMNQFNPAKCGPIIQKYYELAVNNDPIEVLLKQLPGNNMGERLGNLARMQVNVEACKRIIVNDKGGLFKGRGETESALASFFKGNRQIRKQLEYLDSPSNPVLRLPSQGTSANAHFKTLQQMYGTATQNKTFSDEAKKEISNYVFKESIDKKDKLISEIVSSKVSKLVVENDRKLLKETRVISERYDNIKNMYGKVTNDKFYHVLIRETISLQRKGYNETLICEGLFDDIFKGLFGGVEDMAKEELLAYLLKLMGIENNSYLYNLLIVAFGNIPIADIPKLFTDCRFVTKVFAESIPEAMIRKTQENMNLGSGVYDIIRNTLVDAIESTEFVSNLESKLGNIVCPMVEKVKGNMERESNKIKEIYSTK